MRFESVAAEGVVAGNPLKGMFGPVIVAELTTFEYRVINDEPFDPRVATVWMGVINEDDVQELVELTSAVFVTPDEIFIIVPWE